MTRARIFSFAMVVFAWGVAGCSSPAGAPLDGGADLLQAPPADLAPSELDRFILGQMTESHRSAVAASIVKNGEVVWSGAYGLADAELGVPATTDTLFLLASVSKTITAVALMQLWEQGKIGLDDDIDQHLPFSVRNPHHPTTPITARMLLAHTSSIESQYHLLPHDFVAAGPIDPLSNVLRDYVTPGGATYDPSNFSKEAPGTAYSYSSVGSALVALLVERVSGLDFEAYCRQHIFVPLGMSETAWHLPALDPSHIAVPYLWDAQTMQNRALPLYELSAYPAASLRTSVLQLSRFLIAFAQGGRYGAVQLLKPTTVDEMRRVQYPAIESRQGLIWYYENRGGLRLLGHNGYDDGYRSEMFFRPSDGVGVVVLTNGDWQAQDDPAIQIQIRLMQEAARL